MKIKKNLILKEATEIKSFIEKNRKLPLSCTLGNTQLSVYSTAYLMSSALKDKFKAETYNLNPVIIYNNARLTDTINEKVMKEDYLKMASNFVNYCHEHKRVPTYITTQKSKTKVSFELFTFCLAKILVFYQNNKTLPNYCLFNKSDLTVKQNTTKTKKTTKTSSTSTSKKEQNSSIFVSEGHCLKQGKDCIGQIDNVSCGVQALWELLRKFGIKVSKTQLKKWAGTTSAGTSHQGINTAIAMVNKKYNVHITVEWKNFSDLGKTSKERWKNLGKLLSQPNVGVLLHNLYRLKYGHYEDIWKILLDSSSTKTMNSLGVRNADGSFQGYIEDRSFKNWESYLKGISQPSVCILKFKK